MSAPSRQKNIDLLFEPTGDLEKDYCAYCEIEDKNDREDILDGIFREEIEPQLTPQSAAALATSHTMLSSAASVATGQLSPQGEAPTRTASSAMLNATNQSSVYSSPSMAGQPTIRTTINIRNLTYCLNRRDMQPLADAIPHCSSLSVVKLTGCGLTEHSYKVLVEAVYKSSAVHTLAVDMNPDGLFKDPTVNPKRDKNEIVVFPSEFRGAHLRSTGDADKDEQNAPPTAGKRGVAKGKGTANKKVAAAAAAQAEQEAADRVPISIPTGWHAALMTGIQVLSLRGNGIDDLQVRALCDLLASNTDLLSLSLWGNRITSAGARVMAESLSKNTRLLTLNLGHNLIDDDGVTAILGAFLTRDVPYDDMLKARARSLGTAAIVASAATASAAVPPEPSVAVPLFPTFGDVAASGMAKIVEEAPLSRIKGLGIPVLDSASAAANSRGRRGPDATTSSANKKKPTNDGPIERCKELFDADCIRLNEDPIQNPATAALIAQHLSVAQSSNSAAAQSAAIVQLQQLSRFRIPGNTSLVSLNMSYNPGVTSKGVAAALAVVESKEPTVESLYGLLTASAAAETTPGKSLSGNFGGSLCAAVASVSGPSGSSAPASNGAQLAQHISNAILQSQHLCVFNQLKHYVVSSCALRTVQLESSTIDDTVLDQLHTTLKNRMSSLEAQQT